MRRMFEDFETTIMLITKFDNLFEEKFNEIFAIWINFVHERLNSILMIFHLVVEIRIRHFMNKVLQQFILKMSEYCKWNDTKWK